MKTPFSMYFAQRTKVIKIRPFSKHWLWIAYGRYLKRKGLNYS